MKSKHEIYNLKHEIQIFENFPKSETRNVWPTEFIESILQNICEFQKQVFLLFNPNFIKICHANQVKYKFHEKSIFPSKLNTNSIKYIIPSKSNINSMKNQSFLNTKTAQICNLLAFNLTQNEKPLAKNFHY
jgi:hypothetical protein